MTGRSILKSSNQSHLTIRPCKNCFPVSGLYKSLKNDQATRVFLLLLLLFLFFGREGDQSGKNMVYKQQLHHGG